MSRISPREAARALAREKRRRDKRIDRAIAEAKREFDALEAGKAHARGGAVLRRDGTRRRDRYAPHHPRAAENAVPLNQDRP